MSARRGGLTCWLMLLLAFSGCRLPRPYFATSWHQDRAPRFEYDTEFPDKLPPERAHYAQSLAEPVTVVNWQPEVASAWQVMYATNRRAIAADDRPGVRYGNDVETSPSYGVAVVSLPERERGQEDIPVVDQHWPEWLRAVTQRAEHDVQTTVQELRARVNVAQPITIDDFYSRLNDLIARSPQQDVLLFVHGFNVSFEDAAKRATQLAADLPFNGAMVMYAWPSQGGVDMYLRDGQIVDESLSAFSNFLQEFARRVPAQAKVNVVVHSMGNRLVQRALWHLPDEFMKPPRFTEMVFAAPDVGVDEFRRNLRQATKVSQRVTLYQCTNDTALIASMLKNGEERAGSPNAPILAAGMDTIETAAVDVSLLGHSYYGSNPTVLRDLFAIVKEHSPAEQRPWLKPRKMPFQKQPLWIFSDHPEELVWKWHFDRTLGERGQVLPAGGVETR